MDYKERNCEGCGKLFTPKGKNQYGIQKFCSKKCKDKFHKKKENQKKKLGAAPKKIGTALKKMGTAQDQKYTKILEVENLNGINTEYKLITKYKDLAEKTMRTMRKEKLEKYSQKTQDFCLEIMNNLYKFLEQQLERRRIIIASTD